MARILIVDDSIVMRKNLVTIFSDAGHEVVGQASNGKQAVSMYSELMPDLVTMDISMPVMRGIDAVKEIITLHPGAQIIIISALNQKQMVFEALNYGAKHYVIKPIVPNKVLGVINEVLSANKEAEADIKPFKKETDIILPGFQIENTNGSFIITFNENFSSKDINGIETAINGLLFIKPLNIVFNFGKFEKFQGDNLFELKRLSNKIKEAQGNLDVLTDDIELKQKLN
jgi:YesN/AraC family two-component response regulator